MKKYLNPLSLLLILWTIAIFLMNLPMPQDDLLRDMVAWHYSYDYGNLYAYAPYLAKYNQYILFDKIIYWVSYYNVVSVLKYNLHIAPTFIVHCIQLLAYVLVITPVYICLVKITRQNKHRDYIIALALILFLNNFTLLRLSLGRPEIFFTSWVFFGFIFILNSKFSKFVYLWLTIGFLLIPMYWLSIFYSPIVYLVFKDQLSKNTYTFTNRVLSDKSIMFHENKSAFYLAISYFITYIIVSSIFWVIFSEFKWINSILDLGHLNQNRLATIGENKSIMLLFLNPTVAVPVVFILYYYKEKLKNIHNVFNNLIKTHKFNLNVKITLADAVGFVTGNYSVLKNIVFLMFFYILLNMIRYSPIISFGLTITLATLLSRIKLNLNSFHKAVCLIVVIFLPLYVDCYRTIPKFSVPNGSLVLATDLSNYYIPFYNPDTRVVPAMELGANTQRAQKLLKDISINGTVSCDELHALRFNYVSEKTFKTIPSCLKIDQVWFSWRLWKVQY